MYKSATFPAEKERLLAALATGRDDKSMKRALALALDKSTIRDMHVIPLVEFVAGNPNGGLGLAWSFIQKHWKYLLKIDTDNFNMLVEILGGFASMHKYNEIKSFFKTHHVPGIDHSLTGALERIKVNSEWVSRYASAVETWLHAHHF